jgi:thioesterase domain-containing protein
MRAPDVQSEERSRAEISATLTEIWAKATQCPNPGEHSDFYASGGDHFIAPVMIQRINEAMGLTLTVHDLDQGRTIAKLTDLIYFERTRIDRSTVVPLRNLNGSRPPLFIVHGVGGNVLGFYALAKCLDTDQPVYGIQAQALLPDREAVLGLKQMAAQYVQDMRAACPDGPYHLLGFSFGGLVAYEIAQQLHAQGAEVGLLGMLDTRHPGLMRGVRMRESLASQIYFRLRLIYLHTRRRNGRIRYLWRRLRERMQRVNYMYAASKGEGKVVSAVRNVREINYVAGILYAVQPYPGKVTLFRAEYNPQEQVLPQDLGWGQFAADGVTIKDVPGDHGQILHQPGLGVLALQLTSALRETNGYYAAHRESHAVTAGTGRVTMEF